MRESPEERLRRLQASKCQHLARFRHVSDAVVLGAVERAVRHNRFSNRAGASTISIHLGFVPSAWTTRNLRPQLERLVEDGALTVSPDQSVRGWKVTQQGHMRLNRLRRAGELVLPESPQHRAWREARAEAEQGMEEFFALFLDVHEEADDLANSPVVGQKSEPWIRLSMRLLQTCWQVGSALYCLKEWPEPDDAHADMEEFPIGDPRKARRNPANWRHIEDLDDLSIVVDWR